LRACPDLVRVPLEPILPASRRDRNFRVAVSPRDAVVDSKDRNRAPARAGAGGIVTPRAPDRPYVPRLVSHRSRGTAENNPLAGRDETTAGEGWRDSLETRASERLVGPTAAADRAALPHLTPSSRQRASSTSKCRNRALHGCFWVGCGASTFHLGTGQVTPSGLSGYAFSGSTAVILAWRARFGPWGANDLARQARFACANKLRFKAPQTLLLQSTLENIGEGLSVFDSPGTADRVGSHGFCELLDLPTDSVANCGAAGHPDAAVGAWGFCATASPDVEVTSPSGPVLYRECADDKKERINTGGGRLLQIRPEKPWPNGARYSQSISDVTDIKASERKLIEGAQSGPELANRAKGEFSRQYEPRAAHTTGMP